MALCKAKHEGIPMLERTFPINSDSCSGTGHPDASLPAVPWPAAGHLRHLCDSSAPAQEVCSQNGICISCVRTTGPSASSFNAFKNNSLLQSFPPHNICSKCSSFFWHISFLAVWLMTTLGHFSLLIKLLSTVSFFVSYLLLPVIHSPCPLHCINTLIFMLPGHKGLEAAVSPTFLSLPQVENDRALPQSPSSVMVLAQPLRAPCFPDP